MSRSTSRRTLRRCTFDRVHAPDVRVHLRRGKRLDLAAVIPGSAPAATTARVRPRQTRSMSRRLAITWISLESLWCSLRPSCVHSRQLRWHPVVRYRLALGIRVGHDDQPHHSWSPCPWPTRAAGSCVARAQRGQHAGGELQSGAGDAWRPMYRQQDTNGA
jgi:hypothetical protein